MRVISQYIATEKTAGPKAKVDIERILKKEYNAKIYTNKVTNNEEKTIKYKLKKIIFSTRFLKTKEVVVIQIPFSNKKKILKLAEKKIGIIHDIDGLRYNNQKLLQSEVEALNLYNVLIVHNNEMKKELAKNGVKTPMIILEIFDYLLQAGSEFKNNYENKVSKEPIIIYPGNLEPRKSEFLYSLDEEKMNFKIFAYGSNYKENNNNKIIYKGVFSPDILPCKLEGDLGLVWSGKIDSTEEVLEKYYNRFNTPHKLSSFLVAGIPVIVWGESAIAEVVEKYNIGYKINNLYQINDINLDDYEEKKKNAQRLSKKIIEGDFTKKAFDKALKILSLEGK